MFNTRTQFKNRFFAGFVSAPIISLAVASSAAEFYVAPDGDDANPGTAVEPVATIDRARLLVRSARAAGNVADITVTIRGGDYPLDQPLRFDAKDAAPAGSVTTYAAAPGATVLVSGGRRIDGWRQEGELLTVTVPAVRDGPWRFRELFVNGRRATRARAPNDGYYRVVEPGPDRRTSFRFQDGQLQAWSDLNAAELVFFHDWSTSHVRLKTVDPNTRTVTLAAPIGRAMPHYEIGHFEPHPRYHIENARELLDAPGEWHLEEAAGVLRYWPRPGETPESLVAVAPRLEALLTVRGDRATCRFVTGLKFRGLTFSHCGWRLPESGLAMGQASVYEDRARQSPADRSPQAFLPAAVSLDLARGCAFENCCFEHLGATAIEFRETCLENHFEGNVVSDVAANGVNVGETFTRTGRLACLPPAEYPDTVSRGNVLRSNLIERCGQLYPSGVGLWIGMAAETLVENNELRELPYAGISVGWSWNDGDTGCRDNTIRGNEIHRVMQVLSDAGGIYTLGNQPGTVIENNRIHHVPPNVGQAESNGIFFDESTAYLRVTGNRVTQVAKSPLRFHRAHDVLVADNLVQCHPDVAPWKFQGCQASMMTFGANQVREEPNPAWQQMGDSQE
jgi:hypothetical protein